MALDEPKETDAVYRIDGIEYIIDDDLLNAFQLITIDYKAVGFLITGGNKTADSRFGCKTEHPCSC